MVILEAKEKDSTDSRIVIIVGTGLVGSAIVNSLKTLYPFELIASIKINWKPEELEKQLDSIVDLINWGSIIQIDWVWSAGKAGFTSFQQETDTEFILFKIFLTKVGEISFNYNLGDNSTIHLISSAGGLFEGQYVDSKDVKPLPKRPYGRLKLAQENLLVELFADRFRIYRPSSIYGYYRKENRIGLITALVSNALKNKVTSIYGRIDTLRDYVWLGDVATFVAGKIYFGIGKYTSLIFFLVSGKPSGIFEVITAVQKTTNTKVLITYDVKYSNSDQILFIKSIAPAKDWIPTNLEVSIKQIHQHILLNSSL